MRSPGGSGRRVDEDDRDENAGSAARVAIERVSNGTSVGLGERGGRRLLVGGGAGCEEEAASVLVCVVVWFAALLRTLLLLLLTMLLLSLAVPSLSSSQARMSRCAVIADMRSHSTSRAPACGSLRASTTEYNCQNRESERDRECVRESERESRTEQTRLQHIAHGMKQSLVQ